MSKNQIQKIKDMVNTEMGKNVPRETLVLPFTPVALYSSGSILKPSLLLSIDPETIPGHSVRL